MAMIVPWRLTAAMALSGHLLIAPGGAQLPGPTTPSDPPLEMQGNAPPEVNLDRMTRLRQHRAIIEEALRLPRQAEPAVPQEPRARVTRSPEPVPELEPESEPVAEARQNRIDCDAAAEIVANYGFTDIRAASCSGDLYRFSASRDGTAYSIGVTAAAGEIADVSRE